MFLELIFICLLFVAVLRCKDTFQQLPVWEAWRFDQLSPAVLAGSTIHAAFNEAALKMP